MPKVSICLPNLNSAPFLVERFESILSQDFTDFEVLVGDSYSDDDSWDIIERYRRADRRVIPFRIPREGAYAAWNECVHRSQGALIYFATSDDTMVPECLDIMVRALDMAPSCGIATCCCRVIDQNGQTIEGKWESRPVTRYFGDWMNRRHIRRAPHDGLLHSFAATVYLSVTQLLIRRRVFDQVGMFRTDLGSHADFEWGMRASYCVDVVHVPFFLASWRIHSAQLTQAGFFGTTEAYRKFLSMMGIAFSAVRALQPSVLSAVDIERLEMFCKSKAEGFSLQGVATDDNDFIRKTMEISGAKELLVEISDSQR